MSDARLTRLRSHALSWGIQTAALYALWFLLAGSVSVGEMAIGAAVSAAAAMASELVLPEGFLSAESVRHLVQAWRLPGAVVAGTWQVFGVLGRQLFMRRPADSLVLTAPFRPSDGTPADTARAALAVALTSVTPDTVVLGVDRERGVIVYHQLRVRPLGTLTKRLGAAP